MSKEKYTILSSKSLSSLIQQVGKLESQGWLRDGEIVYNTQYYSEYYQAMTKIAYSYRTVCADTEEELITLVQDLVEQGWHSDGSIIVSGKTFCIIMKRKIIKIFSNDVK